MAGTFGEEMNRQKDNPNRMEELEAKEKTNPLKKAGAWIKDKKDKLVNSDEEMEKMTENRADVQNRKEQPI